MDRYPVDISIGGPISSIGMAQLVELVIKSGAGWEWGEYYHAGNEADVLEQMKTSIKEKDSFDLKDDTGNGMTFDDVKDFCVAHDLTYVEHQDAYIESPECHYWWAPGMADEETAPASGGVQCVDVEELRKVMKEACATPGETALKVLDAVETYLNGKTLPVIPPLTMKED